MSTLDTEHKPKPYRTMWSDGSHMYLHVFCIIASNVSCESDWSSSTNIKHYAEIFQTHLHFILLTAQAFHWATTLSNVFLFWSTFSTHRSCIKRLQTYGAFKLRWEKNEVTLLMLLLQIHFSARVMFVWGRVVFFIWFVLTVQFWKNWKCKWSDVKMKQWLAAKIRAAHIKV